MTRVVEKIANHPSLLLILIGLVFALKAYIMAVTPMSLEFEFAVRQAVVGGAHDAGAPYTFVLRLLYAAWLSLPIQHPALSTFWDSYSFHPSVSAYALVFLMKFPLLLLDAATGISLYLILRGLSPGRAGLGFLAWAVNPYVLLVNEMWAPVDLLPVFLMFAGLLLLAKNMYVGIASVAASIAFKLFPIICLPALIVSSRDRRRHLIASTVGSFIAIVAYLAWLVRAGYDPILQLQTYDIYTQYLNFDFLLSTLKPASGIFEFGSGQRIIGLSVVLVVIAAVFVFGKWPHDGAFALDGALFLFLVFLALADWWPQYVLWMLPFVTLDFALRRRSIKYLVLICASALFLALGRFPYYFVANFHAFFFVPADSNSLREAAAAYLQFFSNSIVQNLGLVAAKLIFAATCFVYAGRIMEERTRILSSIFGPVDLFGTVKTSAKAKLDGLRGQLSQRYTKKACSINKES